MMWQVHLPSPTSKDLNSQQIQIFRIQFTFLSDSSSLGEGGTALMKAGLSTASPEHGRNMLIKSGASLDGI
jgi:hypothetical protein